MNITVVFVRIFFLIISIFFLTTYMVTGPGRYTSTNFMIGIGAGAALGLALIGFDLLFKRFNIRSLNIATLGLFFGLLMGTALVLILKAVLAISSVSIHIDPTTLEIIQISLYLFGIYLGTIMTLRATDELYISIPFVKFSTVGQKKRDIVLDHSSLSDGRIIDLAASGLLDNHLIIPRFIIKDLYAQIESPDEMKKAKAKRALEDAKKLETLPGLDLRYNDTDFPEIADPLAKMVRFARLVDANILTADVSKIKMADIEGVRFINLNTLSSALKPIAQQGEKIRVKIARKGNEPTQGVGYLEDGTMVVVNRGHAHIGEYVEVLVLIVQSTPKGRIIFCNMEDQPNDERE